MPLSQAERDQARTRAESDYVAAGGCATSQTEMECDPLFQEFYREEIATIENEHMEAERRRSSVTPIFVLRDPYDTSAMGPSSPCATGEERVPCNFTSLTVNKSGDSNRVFRSTSSDFPILEVVGGHTRASVALECRLEGTNVASCTSHNHRVWNVSPAVGGSDLTHNASLDLPLVWRGNRDSLGFFNMNASPTTYRISASSHDAMESIQVRVYPDYSWEGQVSVLFRVEEVTRNIRFDGAGVQLSLTDDGVTTNYGGRINNLLQIFERWLEVIFDIKDIAETVTRGSITWDLVPPSFVFSINSKWQENTTNLLCGYYYNGRLAFDPLIGIQLTVNLGIIALQALPYIGTLIARMAADEINRYVSFTFTVQGTLGVDVSYSKDAEEESGSVNGGLTGRITFDLQGRAQVNRQYYVVTVNAGIRAGMRGAVSGILRGPQIDRSGSYASATLNFDGISLYVACYGRVGVSSTTDGDAPRHETSTSDDSGGSAERVYPIIDPRQPLKECRFNL